MKIDKIQLNKHIFFNAQNLFIENNNKRQMLIISWVRINHKKKIETKKENEQRCTYFLFCLDYNKI